MLLKTSSWTSHVIASRIYLLIDEAFTTHLLVVTHLVSWESFGTIWTGLFEINCILIAWNNTLTACVTSSSWPHDLPTLTLIHANSWWRFKLLDRLSVCHSSCILLIGTVYLFVWLLINVRRWMNWSWRIRWTCVLLWVWICYICWNSLASIYVLITWWFLRSDIRILLFFCMVLMISLLKLLVTYSIKLFKNINKHRFFCFNISFVRISNKVIVKFSVSSFLFSVLWSMEWIFLIKLVKVFITYFWLNLWNIWWRHIFKLVPIYWIKEWMSFDFFSSITSKSCVCIAYHSFEDISWVRWQFCLSRNTERLLPMHNLLTCDRWLVWKEWWIAYEHFEKNTTYTPPIYCLIISILSKDFWCNIIWSSNCAECQLSISLITKFFIKSWF